VSRLILLRHAEPSEDARGRCYGSLDVGLSDEGSAHAAQLPAALAHLEYDAVYTSPRIRALQTAEPLGRSVIVDDDLRELDFGEFEGRRYEEIEASEPELFRAWMETPTRVRFPGGESYADLKTRAVKALDRIRGQHESALVVTHGGVVRAAVATWLEIPDEAIFRIDQSYCGTTIVDWIDGTPILRLLNYDFSAKSAADGT
jgi:alpha-ribazole phosphatase